MYDLLHVRCVSPDGIESRGGGINPTTAGWIVASHTLTVVGCVSFWGGGLSACFWIGSLSSRTHLAAERQDELARDPGAAYHSKPKLPASM